jgi:hypothetical protein
MLAGTLAVILTGCGVQAASPDDFTMEVLVDGRPLPVYPWRGVRYVEALKGREYAIRLRNPTGGRVAVALSVDGLNTIDARRTTVAEARKWVLGPYETVTIRGWQTSRAQARRFFFTSEEQSYAQRLGRGSDLGIISAVFLRERVPVTPTTAHRRRDDAGRDEMRSKSEPTPSSAGQAPSAAQTRPSAESTAAEEYAATGLGRRTDHHVVEVALDLDPHPVATLDLRYEYRPALVRLGLLPPHRDPLPRRERASGFEPGFSPEPPR